MPDALIAQSQINLNVRERILRSLFLIEAGVVGCTVVEINGLLAMCHRSDQYLACCTPVQVLFPASILLLGKAPAPTQVSTLANESTNRWAQRPQYVKFTG